MHIMALGVNHHTASVELRERLALSGDRLVRAIGEIRQRYPQTEVVILSTCNRVEFYLARPPLESPTFEEAVGFLTGFCGVDAELLAPSLVHFENKQAIEHVFRVASGLESMVLGEPQVLGQVKRAYELAHSCGGVGPVLHRVFQQAIRVAKRTRTVTGIDKGLISVGSVAVDFAKQIYERFDDKTIVGIGAGELAKPMLGYLQRLGPAKLWLTNRSLDKAQAMVTQLGLGGDQGGARPFEDLDDLLMEADIVLTSTGAAQPIVTAEGFKPLLRRRRQRPLFLIDIAVPRDVEPAVGRFSNVYLYNIDDLQRVVEQTHGQRSQQVGACEALLGDEVQACLLDIQQRDIGQLVRSLKRRLEDIGRIEQQRTQQKLASVSQEDLGRVLPGVLEEYTHRLINKILHLPLSQLERSKRDSGLGFYAAALRRLFGLSGQESGGMPEGFKITGITDEISQNLNAASPENPQQSRSKKVRAG